jgi:hypothetical protein
VIPGGLTASTIVNIVQIISDTFYFIEITMFNITHMLEQFDLKHFFVFMKLEQRSKPNPCAIPSYPPTLQIPLPLPSKTLDPWLGSRVLEGKGKGQPFLTPGLPPLIT